MDEKVRVETKTKLPNDAAYAFAVWMKTNNYSIGTIKRYHISVNKMIGKKKYISPEKMKAYLSIKNTLSKRSAIKLFLVFLEDMHNISVVTFRYPRLKTKSNVLEVISKDSFNKIIKCMRSEFKLFAIVMYYGGLRLSECIRIQTDWFNWVDWVNDKSDHGDLKIIKAKRNKERIVPIHPRVMNQIYSRIPKHDDGALKKGYLFDFNHKKYILRKRRKGVPEDAAEQRYVEKVSRFFQISLGEASEKAIGKKIKTHSLRATRATHLDEAGVPSSKIRDILGHNDLSTTSRYIVNTPEKLKEQVKRVDDYFISEEVKNG